MVVEPGLDGVFRHVEGLIDDLIDGGHHVSLAYSSRRGSDRLDSLVERVRQAGGAALDLRVSNQPAMSDLRALIQLRSLISQERPGVIHAHSSKAGALARMLRLGGLDVPVIYTPNAYYGMNLSGGRAKRAFFNLVERILASSAMTVNVSTDEAIFARETLGVRASRQRVIPNGIDLEAYAPGPIALRKALRTRYRIEEDSVVLGTVGRFSAQKDPLCLYRAAIAVAGQHPNLVFAHLGTGEFAGEALKLASDAGLSHRFVQVPYLSNPTEFYHLLDGFVLSSRYEGLSFAVLEALANDLPVILTDVPGNREFLRLGLSHCWDSPSGDAPSLAKAMRIWFEDRNANRISNHRDVAFRMFERRSCCATVVRLYRELIQST